MVDDGLWQYDYDFARDRVILAALIEVWDQAPDWAGPYWGGGGNCIEAATFASSVLKRLHVEREVIVCRARGGRQHTLIGFGDCGAFKPQTERALAGHAVVVGHNWLFDAAAGQFGEDGPVVAEGDRNGVWRAPGIEYHWAPGLNEQIVHGRVDRWGHGRASARMAKLVREIAGPCRAPRAYSVA